MKLTKQMTFRTSEEILAEIRKISESSKKTSSQVINELLFKSLGLDPKIKEKDNKIEEVRRELLGELQQMKTELEQKFSQAQEEALKK